MSKLILYDFLCDEHGLFEDMVKLSVRKVPCPRCRKPSVRQISPVRIDKIGLALQDDASTTSIDYFDRIHRERKAIEENYQREHGEGDYGKMAGSD